jgi:hypothetical protein
VHPDVLLPDGEKYGDAIDKLLRSAFNRYLNYDETSAITDAVWEQVRTPLKLGGLGFLHAPHTHRAAHLASLLDCNKQVEALYKEATKSRPAEQVRSLELAATARELYDALAAEFPGMDVPHTERRVELPEFESLVDFDPRFPTQEALSKAILNQVYLKNMADLPRGWAIRVLTHAQEGAAIFQAMPKWDTHTIESNDFLDIVHANLGLALSFLGLERPCPCGNGIIDREGRHSQVTCPLGNVKNVRHNHVVAVWVAMLRFAGFHVTIESSATLRISNPLTNARTDITIHNWPGKSAHELDVTITDTRAAGHAQVPRPLTAAAASEVDKINKYAEDCARGNAAFTPLVMEAGGRFGEKAAKFFKQVVHAVSLQTTMSKSRISTYWKQRLVIASRCTGIRQQRLLALQLNGMNPEFMVELADELGMNDVEDVREGADLVG